MQCEMEGEWTSNPYYMDLISKINHKIKEKKQISQPLFISQQKPPVSVSTDYEFNDVKFSEKEFFPNHHIMSSDNDVISVMNIQISCFAYWKIFEKRFVDTYQNIILRKLLYFYDKELGLMLEKKFSPSVCKTNFITEEVSITKKRNDIEESLERLNLASDELTMIL
jgi:hypothetical protein